MGGIRRKESRSRVLPEVGLLMHHILHGANRLVEIAGRWRDQLGGKLVGNGVTIELAIDQMHSYGEFIKVQTTLLQV